MANGPIEKIYEDVQLHIAFSQAASRSNIVTYDSTAQEPENISTAFGKLSKWYEALVPTGGSSGKILAWNSSGTAKWSDPLHPTITKSADTTSTASPAHGGTFTTVDSVTRDANGHVTKINTKTVTLPSDQNTDTLMTQTNTTGSADYRVLLSGNANDTTETTTGRKSTNLKFNPSTGVLSASSGVTTKTITRSALQGMLTGSGTAAQDKGSGVSPRYFPAKWTFNTGLTAANGDVFIIKLPTAGHSYGVFLSIDNGANYYPISVNGTSRLTTHYGNGYSIAVMFKSDGSTADVFPLAGGDSRSTVTGGCWQVLNYYDSGNTNTKVNVTLGTTTKAYLLGTSTTPTSSAQAVTSIADTGVYLGTTAGSLYATKFVGALQGNADTATTATKATQDSDGNTISSTYLKLSGGTMTGTLTAKASQYGDEYGGALNMNNSNIYGVNAIYTADVSDNAAEGIHFYRDSTHVDTLWMNGGSLLFVPNRELGTSTTAANSQKVARFTANPTTGQVVITDGTTGGIKSSGSTISATPSAVVTTNWNTESERTIVVTKGWMSYWNGAYNGTSSNLAYCNKGAFGTIVTKSTTDYSKVSFSRNLTSGTKVGTITIDGTSTDLYCQTNTNTDTKVTQSETTTANYRPIVFGATNSTDTSTLAATITDQTYVSTLLYAQPQNGILYANRMYLKAPGSKGQLNLITSKYNVMLRNDDSNTYFLVTAQNDPTGTWTSARPLTINNSTGVCNINGNAATSSSWATARTLTLGAQFTGSVSVKGDTNMTLNGYLKNGLICDESSDFASYAWHKFAEITITEVNGDRSIVFLVSKTWGDVPGCSVILIAHIRTNEQKTTSAASINFGWLIEPTGIDKNNFVLVYTNTADTSTKIELWYKQTSRWDGWVFTVLRENTRGVVSSSWTTYTATGHGSVTYTTGSGDPIKSYSVGIANSITGTAANVTGTVAIAHGGTGATTRLGALRALTEENVGTSAQYFLTITDSWGKGGYTSVANAKTVLGIGAATSSGTANQLAYYSGANTISAAHNGTNTVDSLYFKTGTNAKSARQIILGIYGQTYGNDAAGLISGTAGVFSYGDGGPQIDFNSSVSGSQAGALIFTDHDSAATGASWHFVSNQTDWNVTSKRFHARTGISIGTNLPNTSYNLYVNGTTGVTGVITSTYKSSTYVTSLTSSAITLSDTASSFGGWICGPTKNGRIVISSYQGDNDKLYFGYGERGRTTNSYVKAMTWDGPTNTLTADKFVGALQGNATTATTAGKLSNTSAIGSSTQPVYFNENGVPVACTQDANQAHFSTVPFVKNDGVMEVGRYFDMHSTNTGTTDYDVRLDASGVSSFRFTFNTPTSSSIAPSTNNQTSLGTSSLKWSNVYATTFYGALSGNASTATKLETARNIALTEDFAGSANFDGSGNISISTTFYRCSASSNNTANYPWHRIAYRTGVTGNYNDTDAIFMIRAYYNGGPFGIIKVTMRTNGSGANCQVAARWVVRQNIAANDVYIAQWGTTGQSVYADIFLKGTTYNRTYVYQIAGNRSWTLVNSGEASDTTTSDKKTSTEVYASIAAAGTTLHNQAYTQTVAGIDEGHVNSANSATYATRADYVNVVASNEIRFYNDNQFKANNHFWLGYSWAAGSHYTPSGGSDTSSTTAPNITEFVMGNCTAGGLASVHAKTFILGNGSSPTKSSKTTTIATAATTTDRTITLPDASGNVILGTKGSTSFWGLIDGDGSTSNWIRGTSNGFIPSAGAKFFQTATSSLGTNTWYFKNSYIQYMNANSLILGAAKTADGAQKGQLKFFSGNSSDATGTVTLECIDDANRTGDYTVKLPTCNGTIPVFEKLFEGASNTVSLSYSDIDEYDVFLITVANSNATSEQVTVTSVWISNVAGVHDMPLIWGGAPTSSGGACNVTSGWIQLSKNSGTTTFIVAHKSNVAQMTSSGWSISSPTYNLYIRKIFGLKTYKRT